MPEDPKYVPAPEPTEDLSTPVIPSPLPNPLRRLHRHFSAESRSKSTIHTPEQAHAIIARVVNLEQNWPDLPIHDRNQVVDLLKKDGTLPLTFPTARAWFLDAPNYRLDQDNPPLTPRYLVAGPTTTRGTQHPTYFNSSQESFSTEAFNTHTGRIEWLKFHTYTSSSLHKLPSSQKLHAARTEAHHQDRHAPKHFPTVYDQLVVSQDVLRRAGAPIANLISAPREIAVTIMHYEDPLTRPKLSDLLHSHPDLTPNERQEYALAVARDIGSAIDAQPPHAPQNDLKPDNIIIIDSDSKQARLLDAGNSPPVKQALFNTNEYPIFGSPDFLSPERAQGKPGSPKSDQFSLSLVLYALLNGEELFFDDDITQTMKNIAYMDGLPQEAYQNVADKYGQPVANALSKALSNKPEDRFPTATDFYHSLSKAFTTSSHN